MPAETGAAEKVLNISRTYKRMVGEINSALKPSGIVFDVWTVLQILAVENGRTMSQIARDAELNSPAATKLIDRMVSENLVYRRHSRSDRRIVNIFITDLGLEKFKANEHPVSVIWQNFETYFHQI